MGLAYGTHQKRRALHVQFSLRSLKPRDCLEGLGIGVITLLKRILNEQCGMAWNGFLLLRTGSGGGLLLCCNLFFYFH